jgi:hypothetical protein
MSIIADQSINQATVEMLAKRENAIRESLSAFWPVWTLYDVKARCKIVRVAGSPVQTLYADGVPILEFGPVDSELIQTETGWAYRLTQQYRDLRP